MEPAPAWLSYLSPAMAFIALILSWATYRRSGPRVRVKAHASKNWKRPDEDLEITVVARNTGLAPVQVASIRMAFNYIGVEGLIPTLNLTNEDRREGGPLKFTLEGSHEEVWKFDAIAAMKRQFGERYEDFSLPKSGLSRLFKFMVFAFKIILSMVSPGNLVLVGIVVVVDLGNGIQVTSAPLYRLSYAIFRLWTLPVPADAVTKAEEQ